MEIYNWLQQITPRAFRTFDELYSAITLHFREHLEYEQVTPFRFLGLLIGQGWIEMDEEGEYFIAATPPRPL